jgi:crotonobetainyl-CoA:carnitine CoA-transferase CaiB-like acyl-CoA transferase
MAGPLDGTRVLDLGFWVAGPATAGILADWGAEVIKIEPPTGDPLRAIFLEGGGIEVPFNPAFELDNRGKRSITLDLLTDGGRAIAHRLVAEADVLVTNLRAGALARVGLDFDTVHRLNERLVYCGLSGYGPTGPDRDRPTYDVGAFWARAGLAAALAPEGSDPPQPRGGLGDHTTAMAAVGAVCAGLLARERTGKGQFVSTSLLRAGLYVLGWDVNTRLRFGRLESPYTRRCSPNPLINCYRSGDGRWLWLLGLQGDRHWPDLLKALDRPELAADERFTDIRARRANNTACIEALDAIFATRSFADWAAALDRAGMWWAPVQTVTEVVDDEQARAGGGFVRTPIAEGEADMVATPADFAATPWRPGGIAPELGQHSEEILIELGYDWEAIAALRAGGALG